MLPGCAPEAQSSDGDRTSASEELAAYPFHSDYEYFRFYKWDKEATYPMADPTTQPPAGDVDYSQNNSRETTYP